MSTQLRLDLTPCPATNPELATESDYDQRLYDALWYAHFEWSRNDERPVNFTFTFLRKHLKTEDNLETSLRLRGESQSLAMFLGLREDFRKVSTQYFPN